MFVVPNVATSANADSHQTASIDRFSRCHNDFPSLPKRRKFDNCQRSPVAFPVIETRTEQRRPEVVGIVPRSSTRFPTSFFHIASIHPFHSEFAQLRINNSIITDDIPPNTTTVPLCTISAFLRVAHSPVSTRLQRVLEFEWQGFVFSNVQTEIGPCFVSDRL